MKTIILLCLTALPGAAQVLFKGATVNPSSLIQGPSAITLNVPAGYTYGDTLVAVFVISGTTTDTYAAPAGWTFLQRYVSTSVNNIGFAYVKRVGISEPASYTWTNNNSANVQGYVGAMHLYSPASVHAFVWWGSPQTQLTTTQTSLITWFYSLDWPQAISDLRRLDAGSPAIVNWWNATGSDTCAIAGGVILPAGTTPLITATLGPPGAGAGAPSLVLSLVPAGVTEMRIISSTPTQIIIGFRKSSADVASIKVSESSSYSPLVHDVDPSLYAGSDLDSRNSCIQVGVEMQCVLGTRSTERSIGGKAYSRALRADTLHYIQVTLADGSVGSITATTKPPVLGNRYRDVWSMDTAPGKVLWPTKEYLTRGVDTIEPNTGVALRSWALPGDIKALFGPAALAACYQGTGWTLNSCGAIGAGGSTYAGTSQDWLALGIPSIPNDGSGGFGGDWMADRWGTNPIYPRWLKFIGDLWFTGADLSGADRAVDVCWGLDDLGCTSPVVTITAGTTQGTFNICNASGTGTCTDGDFWGPEMPEAAFIEWSSGKIYNSGSSTTVNFRDATDCKKMKPGMGLFVNTGAGITQYAVNSIANCTAGTPSLTLTSAVDLTPPSPGPTDGWPFYHQHGLARNPAFSFLVRKHSTTANNTLHVANAKYSFGGGGLAAGSSTGEFTVCSGETKLSAQGFMHCFDAVGRTFAIKPDTGETRYIGTPVADTSGVGRAVLGTLPVLWEDANNWWALAGVSGGGSSLFKATLAAQAQADNAAAYISVDGGNETWYDTTVVNMLGTNKIGTLIQTFNPTFDPTLFPSCSATSYNVNRYLVGVCRMGSQDTYGWPWVYDLGNKLPLGLGGTGGIVAAWPSFASSTKVAWGTIHASHVTLDTSWVAMQNTIAKEDLGGPGNQKFWMTYDAYWNGSAWVAGNAPSDPTVRMRFTSSWNGAWGTQPPTFGSGDPISTNFAPHWLQKVAVGNQLFVNSGAEHLEIVSINGQDSNGLDITVTRRACNGDAYQTISVGVQVNPNLKCNVLDWWWNALQGPNGADSSVFLLSLPGGGHQVDGRYYNVGTPEVGYHACDIETDPSCFPMDVTNRTEIIQRSEPGFAGKIAPIFGSGYEGHPGFYPEPGGGPQRFIDIHPFIAGFTTYTVAWVTGDLFKLTSPSGYPLTPKFFNPMFSMGSTFSGVDVSSPSVTIDGTSTYAYKYCIANAAGECRPGSSAGDIYVNYPAFGSKSTMCQDSSLTADDLCVENTAAEASAVGLYAVTGLNNKPTTIGLYKGIEWMSLVQTPRLYNGKGLANTSNVKMLSLSLGWLGPYLVRLPRVNQIDSINRSTFYPLTLKIGSVPPQTDNVVVEFGYAEFGTPSQFYCSTRRETCNAVGAALNETTPFYWSSEAFSGLSCSSSCTVTIPLLPSHTVYYRVKYRNSGNAVISTGRTQVAAAP